jgi:GNAT superfamily N-acetyltransferase
MLTIERAHADDMPVILGLLNNARRWLAENGISQWPNEFRAECFAPYIGHGEMWIVRDEKAPVATMRLSFDADPAFWTATEAGDLAAYVSRFAVRDHGTGIGELLARWATDKAARLGYKYVRLDCRRDNARLQEYYRSRGWEYLRTVEAPGRFSGALFQRPAVADLEARSAFARPPTPGGWLDPGAPVHVDRKGTGLILAIDPGWDENGPIVQEYDNPGYSRMPGYLVQLDSGGQVVTVERSEVHAICAARDVGPASPQTVP